MNSIFVVIPLFFSLNTIAQKREVVIDSSKTKTAIFSKTLLWIANTWGDPAKVINNKDEATGTILVKAGLKAVPKSEEGYAVKGLTLTELSILVSDGKAELDFAHTVFEWDSGTSWNFEDTGGGSQKAQWKTDVLNEILEMIAGYRAGFK